MYHPVATKSIINVATDVSYILKVVSATTV